MMIHELPTPLDGVTHVREGEIRLNRENNTITMELLGGTLDAGGGFVPHRRFSWTTASILPDRWNDLHLFASEFELDSEPRGLVDRFAACVLYYAWAVEGGLRPQPETVGPVGPDEPTEVEDE